MRIQTFTNKKGEVGWAIVLTDREMREVATKDPARIQAIASAAREAYLVGEESEEA